jgi:transposase
MAELECTSSIATAQRLFIQGKFTEVRVLMETLGVDISKSTFHAVLVQGERLGKKIFANSKAGFAQLDAWLRNRGARDVFACMEATGSYWEALATHLFEGGVAVAVVNPSRIKAYAQSELLRTKTDAVDAGLIARFAIAQRPTPWEPPAPEIRELQGLARQLEFLKTSRAQHVTRAQTPGLPMRARISAETLIAAFDGQIDELERAIRDHINQHPGLKSSRDLLTSIPGIGDTTASAILAEMPGIGTFTSARAVAAFAGLSPHRVESGSSVRGKTRLCKTGNARIRKALYFPAIVAKNHNPLLKAFAQRLNHSGKPKMVVIGAVMRKLLTLAYGVLKSGQPFDPNFSRGTA